MFVDKSDDDSTIKKIKECFSGFQYNIIKKEKIVLNLLQDV